MFITNRMETQHWNALPTFFADLLEKRQPQFNENFQVSTVGAIVHVPRAINIRQTRLARAQARELNKENYLAPVAPAQMATCHRTGEIRRGLCFLDWFETVDKNRSCPQSICIYSVAAGRMSPRRGTVSRKQQPLPSNIDCLSLSVSNATRLTIQHSHPDWARARLVAFDKPVMNTNDIHHRWIPGDVVGKWPYKARYELLCHVVAVWNRLCMPRLGNHHLDLLPLCVIRQYSVEQIPELFAAVVHGMTWKDRRASGLLPFGCPLTRKQNGKYLAHLDQWYGDAVPDMHQRVPCTDQLRGGGLFRGGSLMFRPEVRD